MEGISTRAEPQAPSKGKKAPRGPLRSWGGMRRKMGGVGSWSSRRSRRPRTWLR